MEILAIISVVVSILNIILFFKIWGMTSDVKEILKMLGKKEDFSCIVSGDKAEIENLLVKRFTNDVRVYFDPAKDGNMDRNYAQKRIESIATEYNRKAEKLGVTFDFSKAAGNLLEMIDVLTKCG